MARSEDLPVFRACYDLLLYVMNWSVNVKRDLRYTVAEDYKKRLVETEVCIYKANRYPMPEKLAQVRRAQELMVEAMIYLRLLGDMRQITLQQYAVTAEKAVEVEKHLANWDRWLEKSQEEGKEGRQRQGTAQESCIRSAGGQGRAAE